MVVVAVVVAVGVVVAVVVGVGVGVAVGVVVVVAVGVGVAVGVVVGVVVVVVTSSPSRPLQLGRARPARSVPAIAAGPEQVFRTREQQGLMRPTAVASRPPGVHRRGPSRLGYTANTCIRFDSARRSSLCLISSSWPSIWGFSCLMIREGH